VEVAVTNDRPETFAGEVRWSLESLTGAVVASGVESVAAVGAATTRVCVVVAAAGLARDIEGRRRTVFVAELWSGDRRLAMSVTPFAADKQLLLTAPRTAIDLEVDTDSGRGLVRLRSESLARWVELALDGADLVFDDNYFDLPAGREVVVGFDLPEGWTRGRAQAALQVRSLVDTYAG
jgi:beta-mannosidase